MPQPRARRAIVTLIAGFRCAFPNIPEEMPIVVCADSQETVQIEGHEYRVTRQKINPKVCGNFELAIGGSGPNGTFIDACVHRIEKGVSKFNCETLPELQEFISAEILDFGKKDAKLFSSKERLVNFLVVARSLRHPAVEAWHAKAAQLIPIPKHVLVGWNEDIYEHFAERLYPEGSSPLPPQQAVLLGMYLMTLAENTSNYVRGPVRVIIARNNGITVLDKKRVNSFRERIELFSAQLDTLILACADHTLRRDQYIAKLDEFRATALQIRDEYVKESVLPTLEEMFKVNDPIQNFPAGTLTKMKDDRSVEISEDPAEVADFAKKIQMVQKQTVQTLDGAGPIKGKIHCECGHTFEVQAENFSMFHNHDFPCDRCGKVNRVTNVTVNVISPA